VEYSNGEKVTGLTWGFCILDPGSILEEHPAPAEFSTQGLLSVGKGPGSSSRYLTRHF
jgi:hypothetical protein